MSKQAEKEPKKKRFPFSLCCMECDAGSEFSTKAEAQKAGWIDIRRDITGPSWSDLGVCPECQLEMAQRDAIAHTKSAWAWINPAERPMQDSSFNAALLKRQRDPVVMLEEARECGKAVYAAEKNVAKLEAWKQKQLKGAQS